MSKTVRALVVGLVLVMGYIAAWAFFEQKALQLYAGSPRFRAEMMVVPDSVAAHAAQLDRDLQELQRLEPGLAKIERKYLGQPLEETQSLLFTYAEVALSQKDRPRWDLLVRILNGIWLQERDAPIVDVPHVRTLHQFEQRVRALYAQAGLQRWKESLPETSPWAAGMEERALMCRRLILWKQWQRHSSLPTWLRACRVLQQLEQWPVESPMVELQDLKA